MEDILVVDVSIISMDALLPHKSYEVDIWKIHESYGRRWLIQDIALIKVKRDIQFSPTSRAIGLAPKNFRYVYGDGVLLIGLGQTEVIISC